MSGEKPHQYHAGDLFDIETFVLDLAQHARHLIPSLAPLVGQPILNAADFELQVDHSKSYLEGQLAPLICMIWKVVRFVDDRIHLQQAAGATKVGYNAFYEHELAQINGVHHFSGSKADREYWSQNTRDAEKDIIKIKAHEKLLAGMPSGKAPSRNENGSAAQDGNSPKVSSTSRRNKKQRLLYKKQQKAKKAQNKQNQPKAIAAPALVKSDP